MSGSLEVVRRELKDEEKARDITETKVKRLQRALLILERPVGRSAKVALGDPLAAIRKIDTKEIEAVLYVLIDAPEEGMLRREMCEKANVSSSNMSHIIAKLIAENKIIQTNAPFTRCTRWKLVEEN